MKIIGLSGTNGSGKDTVGRFLAENYNFIFISGSDMLRAEADKRGLPHERENLRGIGNEWRKKFGSGVLIIKAAELAETAGKNLVIASIRSVGEADEIHARGGILIWTDADPEVRYKRVCGGGRARADDDKTYEQFLEEERAEMEGSDDTTTLNMSQVKVRADLSIDNSSSDFQKFTSDLKEILKDVV